MRVTELLEGKRDKSLNYETVLKGKSGEIDKVVLKLEGTKSGSFTKLAKEYKELQTEFENAKIAFEDNKAALKGKMEELFDPADDVLTRVVETCSLTLQLAKAVQPSEKTEVDYKTAFDELVKTIEGMVPDLKDNMKTIVECTLKAATSTKPVAGKSGAFTVKEGFVGDFMDLVRVVRMKIAKALNKYDKKLAKAKADMTKLQAMQSRIDRGVAKTKTA